MPAEIIAIGSELTHGAKLDTNSQWLSLALADIGHTVKRHVTIADDLDAMVDALRGAAARVDLVLITGGLGPTLDDLTREAMARLAGVPLVLHEPSLAQIKSFFERRQRPMPERNLTQAMVPQGAEMLPNPRGTAPGVWMELPRPDGTVCRLAAMPGVPSEMKPMFRAQVIPRLDAGDHVIRRARINCFGVGESQAEELLGDLTARGRDPEVGITAHESTITLRIVAEGLSIPDCETKIGTARQTILNRLGVLVFGEEDEELEHAIIRLLTQQRKTVSTAESGTGGLLAYLLTGVAGFERCYPGGVVVPTHASKRELLSVDSRVLEYFGAISSHTAEAMAVGCRKKFGTDFSLAVTEWPTGETQDPLAPVPSSYVALASRKGTRVEEVKHLGDPAITRVRTAKTALNLLRLQLLSPT